MRSPGQPIACEQSPRGASRSVSPDSLCYSAVGIGWNWYFLLHSLARVEPMIKLTLASESPYRLELLRQAGYEVQSLASGVVEPDLSQFDDLAAGLRELAKLKARGALAKGATGLILAADTVSWVAGEVMGKPSSREAARQMLLALSGAEHCVLTGWCLISEEPPVTITDVEQTNITMRCWTDAELDAYLDSGEWEGKCGAYGLRIPDDPFVIAIEGSASNVIGVPLERLAEALADLERMRLD
jgi:septum formation protein